MIFSSLVQNKGYAKGNQTFSHCISKCDRSNFGSTTLRSYNGQGRVNSALCRCAWGDAEVVGLILCINYCPQALYMHVNKNLKQLIFYSWHSAILERSLLAYVVLKCWNDSAWLFRAELNVLLALLFPACCSSSLLGALLPGEALLQPACLLQPCHVACDNLLSWIMLSLVQLLCARSHYFPLAFAWDQHTNASDHENPMYDCEVAAIN